MPAPTKYNPSKNKEVIAIMSEGASIIEVADLLDISRETIYDWCNKESPRFNQQFSDTINKGLIKSQVWWEKTGRENIDNPKFSWTGWFMNVKNRFHKDWRDKQEIKQDIDAKVSIKWEEPDL